MANSRWLAGAVTLSWIDPKTGLPEVDKGGDPGAVIKREDIKEGRLYRFSNFLEAFIEIDTKGVVLKAGFTDQSGMYRGPSAFGFESAAVGKIARTMFMTRTSVTFRQLVGCRTVSPERLGSLGGATLGGAVGLGGVVAGAKLGAVSGVWAGPVGMFIGAVTLGTVGYFTGREVAEFASAFPPIWTELELTMFSDSSLRYELVSHSVFPSTTLYAHATARKAVADRDTYDKIGSSYDGDGLRLKRWKENGWGPATSPRSGATDGNPWGMTDPAKVLGGGSVAYECPQGYICN